MNPEVDEAPKPKKYKGKHEGTANTMGGASFGSPMMGNMFTPAYTPNPHVSALNAVKDATEVAMRCDDPTLKDKLLKAVDYTMENMVSVLCMC